MHIRALSVAGAVAVMLAGCAAPVVWVKPGANEADFGMDRARCQLLAEGMNPDTGVATISTGKVGTDIAANLGAGMLHGIAQGMKEGHTFSLCMEASGYVATRAPRPEVARAVAAVPAMAATEAKACTDHGGDWNYGTDTCLIRPGFAGAGPIAPASPAPPIAAVAAPAASGLAPTFIPAELREIPPMDLRPCGMEGGRPCN